MKTPDEHRAKKNPGHRPAITIETAFVLAAGAGRRLRPITDATPKPMVKVNGKPLLDHALDRLAEDGVRKVVVNVHHLADQIIRHLKNRVNPEIVVSDETDALLETGGGVLKGLPLLGGGPFFVVNSDTLWLNGLAPALERLRRRWDPDVMDGLLLLHSTVDAYGYSGDGDFMADGFRKLVRRPEREVTPYLFTGIQILKPGVFEGAPEGPFSLNWVYDRLLEKEKLHGLIHDGEWFHVGTAEGLGLAENYLSQRYAETKHR